MHTRGLFLVQKTIAFSFILFAVFFGLFHFGLLIQVYAAENVSVETARNVVGNYKVDLAKYSVFGADCTFKNKGDANCDSKVNQLDLSMWEVDFNQSGYQGRSDFNQDGKVDLLDYTVWKKTFYNEPNDLGSSDNPLRRFISSALKAISLTVFAQEGQPNTQSLTGAVAIVSDSGNSTVVSQDSNTTRSTNFDQNGNVLSSSVFGDQGQFLAAIAYLASGTTLMSTQKDGVSVGTNLTKNGSVVESYHNSDGSLLAIKSWSTQQSYDKGEPPISVTLPASTPNHRITLNVQPNGGGTMQEIDGDGKVLKVNQILPNGYFLSEDLQNQTNSQSISKLEFSSYTEANKLGGNTSYTFYRNKLTTVSHTDDKKNFWQFTQNPDESWKMFAIVNGEQIEKDVADPTTEVDSGTVTPTTLVSSWESDVNNSKNANPTIDFATSFNGNKSTQRLISSQISTADKAYDINYAATQRNVLGLSIVKEAYASGPAPWTETKPASSSDKKNEDGSISVVTSVTLDRDNGDGTRTSVTVTTTVGTNRGDVDNSADSNTSIAITTAKADGSGGVQTAYSMPGAVSTPTAGTLDATLAGAVGKATTDEGTPIPSIPSSTPSQAGPGQSGPTQTQPQQPAAGAAGTGRADADAAIAGARAAAGGGTPTANQVLSQIAKDSVEGGWTPDRTERAVTAAKQDYPDIKTNSVDNALNTAWSEALKTADQRGEQLALPPGYHREGNTVVRDSDGMSIGEATRRDVEANRPGNTRGDAPGAAAPPANAPGATGPGGAPTGFDTRTGVSGSVGGVGFTQTFNQQTGDVTAKFENGSIQVTHTRDNPDTARNELGTVSFTYGQGSSYQGVDLSGVQVEIGTLASGGFVESITYGGETYSINNDPAGGPGTLSRADGTTVSRGDKDEGALDTANAAISLNNDSNGRSQPGVEGTCFLAGTLISTPKGPVPIENLKPGMKVYSYNTKTGQKQISDFDSLDINLVSQYLVINSRLHVTDYHPMFKETSEGLKLVRADELKVGDKLVKDDNTLEDIDSIEHVIAKTTVYNLVNVSLNNTFFAEGILVHNYGGGPEGGPEGPGGGGPTEEDTGGGGGGSPMQADTNVDAGSNNNNESLSNQSSNSGD